MSATTDSSRGRRLPVPPRPRSVGSLATMAAVIAGALNVLGLRRVVITGDVLELPPAVFTYLSDAIIKGALWARFGELKVEKAPRRRKAGLVAAGIDRFIFPVETADLAANARI